MCIMGKGLDAIGLNRIGIAHQHHRRRRVFPAKLTHQDQHAAQAHAMRQCPFGSTLNGGSIRHRIGKRHAEFDDVGAPRHQCPHQRQTEIGMRITGGNEGNQGLAALRGKSGECCRNA